MDDATTPRDALSRAAAGARLSALLIDVLLLGVVAFVAMIATVIVSTPFWRVDGHTNGSGAGGGSAVLALDETLPPWVSWVVLGIIAVAAVLLSGAGSKPGSRRSFGLVFAELGLARTGDHAWHGAPPGLADVWIPARMEPARWRIAARWLLPLATFALLVPFVGGLAAGLVTLGGWAPSLVGPRRSVYDLLAGVVVIDIVRSMRRAQDAASRAGRPDAS